MQISNVIAREKIPPISKGSILLVAYRSKVKDFLEPMTEGKDLCQVYKEKELEISGILFDYYTNEWEDERDYDFICQCGSGRLRGLALIIPKGATCIVCDQMVN